MNKIMKANPALYVLRERIRKVYKNINNIIYFIFFNFNNINKGL